MHREVRAGGGGGRAGAERDAQMNGATGRSELVALELREDGHRLVLRRVDLRRVPGAHVAHELALAGRDEAARHGGLEGGQVPAPGTVGGGEAAVRVDGHVGLRGSRGVVRGGAGPARRRLARRVPGASAFFARARLHGGRVSGGCGVVAGLRGFRCCGGHDLRGLAGLLWPPSSLPAFEAAGASDEPLHATPLNTPHISRKRRVLHLRAARSLVMVIGMVRFATSRWRTNRPEEDELTGAGRVVRTAGGEDLQRMKGTPRSAREGRRASRGRRRRGPGSCHWQV